MKSPFWARLIEGLLSMVGAWVAGTGVFYLVIMLVLAVDAKFDVICLSISTRPRP